MSIAELGSLGEFVASIAVVITLVMLTLQIRQNTMATRYQTTQHLVTGNSQANFLLASSTELAALHRKGCLDPDALSDDERLQFNTFYFAYYNQFDLAYHQYKQGQLDEVMWKKMEYEMPIYLSLPGLRRWWESDKVRMSAEFVAYLEDRVANLDPASRRGSRP